MKDEIIGVSNIIHENEELYGDAAREKIIVHFKNNNGKGKREEYLDNPKTTDDLFNYLNKIRLNNTNIHLDSFERTWKNRLLWNSIMAVLGIGAIFLVPNLSKVLSNANSSVMGVINYYIVAAIDIGLFTYVNQKKFYYSKNEIQQLDKNKNSIDKVNEILKSIELYKEKELDNQRIRSDIDYLGVRARNHDRNVRMYHEKEQYLDEARKRINKGAKVIREKNKHQFPIRNLQISNNYDYSNTRLSKKQKFKHALRSVGNWLLESFEDEDYERGRRR